MNDQAMRCTVCGRDSILWAKLQKLEIRKCQFCSHLFTDQKTIQPETYSADYYLNIHRRWFENPNYQLFSLIQQDLRKRNINSVLDAGCGNGDFLKYLAANKGFSSLHGIDLSTTEELARRFPTITLMQGDFLTHQFPSTFDAIVSLAVIEHMEDVRAFQKRIHALLSDKGVAYIMTLNSDGVLYRLANFMRKIGFSFIFKRLYDPHHLNHFNKRSLTNLLTQDGAFSVVKVIDHNAPLKAIDIPVSNPVVGVIMRAGVKAVFMIGSLFRKTYLQTLIVQKNNLALNA